MSAYSTPCSGILCRGHVNKYPHQQHIGLGNNVTCSGNSRHLVLARLGSNLDEAPIHDLSPAAGAVMALDYEDSITSLVDTPAV